MQEELWLVLSGQQVMGYASLGRVAEIYKHRYEWPQGPVTALSAGHHYYEIQHQKKTKRDGIPG